MIYVGEFADIHNKYKYQVTFETKSGSGNQEIQLSGEDPIIIRQNGDKLFDPIKTQSATVKIVSAEYLYPLYNAGYNVSVTIKRKNYNATDYTIVLFYGYVTPNIYNQTYQYVDEIEIECISDLAMLKYQDYATINDDKMIYSVADIIKRCLNNTRYTYLYMVTPDYYGFDRDAVGQTKCTQHDILKALYLDEVNFFDDNEEQTPWTRYEVLEEIMKYLDLSLVEYQYKLMAINYGQNWKTNDNVHSEVYNLRTLDTRNNSDTVKLYNITESSYFSSDNNVSLDETYKKIKIKANTYPYDEVFNEILDPDNWELSPKYETQGALPQANNAYVPYFSWKVDNDNVAHAYYLYYVSSLMKPYLYDVSGTSLVANTQNPNGYLTAMLDDEQQQRRGRYRCGVGLMKIAQYKADKYSVTSKLDWKSQIVLYTGVNNFNVKDYYFVLGDPRNPSKKCQDAVNTYMQANFGRFTNNWMPQNPMLEIKSASPINVSADSYLIISGRIMVNDLEWEGSVKDEWNGCDQFSRPMSYKLYDQTIDFPANRNYIGFPVLQMQVRIGNQILWNRPIIESGERVGFEYTWAETKPDGYLSCAFELPIGTDKWGFYKFYDITNTCDWRLGLEKGKGFAIPMPADKGLTGIMTIYIVGPTSNLYYLYVPNINKLPTIKKTYTVTMNPNNTWKYSHIPESPVNVEIDYSGTMPSCIVIQNLSFDIEEVTYHTYSDTVLKKADNKKTDHEYENIINMDSIIDAEEIECKINTQDLEKCRSFSSMLYKYNNEWQYINTMTENAPTENSQAGTYRIQEDNIIQTYKSHYETPKVIFECDLNDKMTVNPTDLFTCDGVKSGIHMIPNTQEMNLKMGNNKLQLIEI